MEIIERKLKILEKNPSHAKISELKIFQRESI